MLAAFGRGVNSENIQQVAVADKRYLEAKELDGKFGLGETQRVPTCSQRMLEQPDRSTSWHWRRLTGSRHLLRVADPLLQGLLVKFIKQLAKLLLSCLVQDSIPSTETSLLPYNPMDSNSTAIG